jgi:hypothetical protein
MAEVIGVSDGLDYFGSFPDDVKTASVDVWQGFSFTNFKLAFCLSRKLSYHWAFSLQSGIFDLFC